MAISGVLADMGIEPEELNISAVCTFDADQVKVTKMVLDVRGRIPGLDAEGFQNAAEQADQGCPVSNACAATWTSSSMRAWSKTRLRSQRMRLPS
jgi:osmotically inducible protein OsmC